MLNHFRTLLVNLPYVGNANEHIPSSFTSLSLQKPYKDIYNILFPPASSRDYKLFLAHNYLSIVIAAGLQDHLKDQDSRISYINGYNEYFKINRHSKPLISDQQFPIFIYGNYTGGQLNDSFFDDYVITQIDNTTSIAIYSDNKQGYIIGNNVVDDITQAEIELIFENNVSLPINIAATGIGFSIDGGDRFSNTSDKTWEFIVEAPYVFNLSAVVANLKNSSNTSALFNLAKQVDTTTYQNLWNSHYNPVYNLAGLLLAYIAKLDSTL